MSVSDGNRRTSHGLRKRHSTRFKLDAVSRLLRGDDPARVALEIQCPERQLRAWSRIFVKAGTLALNERASARNLEELRQQNFELSGRVTELEQERRIRTSVTDQDCDKTGHDIAVNPYCSAQYAASCVTDETELAHISAWGTAVRVHKSAKTGQASFASGLPPHTSLAAQCDLRAGLEQLRRQGVASISFVTDPMTSPTRGMLSAAFPRCRDFKRTYLIDRVASPVKYAKHHRNRINGALKACQIEEVPLAECMSEWRDLYDMHVQHKNVAQPFSASYFERLAQMKCLTTLLVRHGKHVVTIALWLRWNGIVYYHDAASSDLGFSIGGAYAAVAAAIERFQDCRYLYLGGSVDYRARDDDGLGMFKRGFCNTILTSYWCHASLHESAT